MNALDAFTDFATMSLPAAENGMSRRYQHIVQRWIPVVMRYYNDWPGRPDCGHFFGGVYWYGMETAYTIAALAVAAASPEFDPLLAGMSADEVRQVIRRGLRYLCFTHDTGPADCIRPKESWGRTEPAGTKWGERGQGFFRESQCGRTIADLAVAAALVADLLKDEERAMLANIAADYMAHFGDMEPRSGVYYDTQMEENAWTAEGMVACMMLLPGHPRRAEWFENAKRWMFNTSTMPQDMYDWSEFAGGRTVRELCARRYTMLPDGTAENHGFVHPSYMASSVHLSGLALNLFRLYGQDAPPHLLRRRRECYELLKSWCDDDGAPHCVQGMDWPYFMYPGHCFFHAVGNLYLGDPDAALLERRSLEVVERAAEAHAGHMVPENTARYCHGQQDPAIMRETRVVSLAAGALAHRLLGAGAEPSDPDDLARRMRGVRVYPHGSIILHRHERGITSFAWRNRTMVLPCTREGRRLIGPAAGSMLAQIRVRDKADSAREVWLKIRESRRQVCAAFLEDLAEGSVRRQVFFASLPDGTCLTAEQLVALEDVTVEEVRQGYLSIINDGYFGDHEDLRGHRRVFWQDSQREFEGYAADLDTPDEIVELGDTGWVNVDNRFGFVFHGSGRPVYRNPHFFKVWHATENDLILNLHDEPAPVRAGDRIAWLAALWLPEQQRDETARTVLEILAHDADLMAVRTPAHLCACNFRAEEATLAGGVRLAAEEPVIAPRK